MAAEVDEYYKPSDDEPFMNERQREYFRAQAARLEGRDPEGKQGNHRAPAGREPRSARSCRPRLLRNRPSLELRTRDRQRKLISKIDAALKRIEDGSYGYCEETGEPISLKRLDASPIATLSIEAQERHERRERVYRDD